MDITLLSLIAVISTIFVVLGIIIHDYAEGDGFQAGVGTVTTVLAGIGLLTVIIYAFAF